MANKKVEKISIEFTKEDCVQLASMCSFMQFDGRYFDKETCAYLLSFFTTAIDKIAASQVPVK